MILLDYLGLKGILLSLPDYNTLEILDHSSSFTNQFRRSSSKSQKQLFPSITEPDYKEERKFRYPSDHYLIFAKFRPFVSTKFTEFNNCLL